MTPSREKDERRPSEKDEERFNAKYLRLGDDDCWPWLACLDQGYGVAWYNGRKRGAHVVAYERAYGPVPPHMEVCHSCDLASCCNPRHLRADSHAANLKEAADRGRMLQKLTLEDVRRIRSLSGSLTLRRLGEMFNIHWTTIHHHLKKAA